MPRPGDNLTSRTTIPAEAFWRTTLAAAGCNHFDYSFSLPELRAVNSTSAFSDKAFLRAVDATAASFSVWIRMYESQANWGDAGFGPDFRASAIEADPQEADNSPTV
jgi:hypothetical protein